MDKLKYYIILGLLNKTQAASHYHVLFSHEIKKFKLNFLVIDSKQPNGKYTVLLFYCLSV